MQKGKVEGRNKGFDQDKQKRKHRNRKNHGKGNRIYGTCADVSRTEKGVALRKTFQNLLRNVLIVQIDAA